MELAIQDCLPVRAAGFDEDVPDGLVVLVTRIELAAALGLAEMDPVGGAIAGARPASADGSKAGSEERVVDDHGQVALAGGRIPAHETVPQGGFPSGGAEAKQGQK